MDLVHYASLQAECIRIYDSVGTEILNVKSIGTLNNGFIRCGSGTRSTTVNNCSFTGKFIGETAGSPIVYNFCNFGVENKAPNNVLSATYNNCSINIINSIQNLEFTENMNNCAIYHGSIESIKIRNATIVNTRFVQTVSSSQETLFYLIGNSGSMLKNITVKADQAITVGTVFGADAYSVIDGYQIDSNVTYSRICWPSQYYLNFKGIKADVRGTTRPTLNNTSDIGYMFFEINNGIKKPIWWTGTDWVDATGTTV